MYSKFNFYISKYLVVLIRYLMSTNICFVAESIHHCQNIIEICETIFQCRFMSPYMKINIKVLLNKIRDTQNAL